MATVGVYANSLVNIVPSQGGVLCGTMAATTGVYQGNAGTSLPCKKCWVQAAISNVAYIMMNINAAATSILGITLPGTIGLGAITACVSTAVVPPPMEIEIDDVSKLYFHSTTPGDLVNIMYRL